MTPREYGHSWSSRWYTIITFNINFIESDRKQENRREVLYISFSTKPVMFNRNGFFPFALLSAYAKISSGDVDTLMLSLDLVIMSSESI